MEGKKTVKNPFGSASSQDVNSTDTSSGSINLPPEPGDFLKSELAKRGLNEDSLNLGLNIGKQIIKESKFVDYFSLNGLKPYFEIDNSYVIYKLKNILFPFYLFKKESNPTDIINNNSSDAEDAQKLKIEYPDMYIPLMSFITYILLIGFNSSYQSSKFFDPQILGKISTKNSFIILMETFLLKMLLFMFSSIPVSFFDCMAYVGYKFVLLVICVIVWILTMTIGKYPLYISIGIVSLLSTLYLQKCLKMKTSGDNKFQKLILLLAAPLEVITNLIVLLDIYLYS